MQELNLCIDAWGNTRTVLEIFIISHSWNKAIFKNKFKNNSRFQEPTVCDLFSIRIVLREVHMNRKCELKLKLLRNIKYKK